MAFKAYLVEQFENTHENTFFRIVSTELETLFSQAHGLSVLLGNVSCNGNQIDAIFISRGKFIIIDFKDYGGNLTFSQNDSWKINDGVTSSIVRGGGGNRNPFNQVRDYKFSVLNYLNNYTTNFLDANHDNFNLGHISAMILFQQPINFDRTTLPENIRRWFYVTDTINYTNNIVDITSKELNLSDNEINKILGVLNISEDKLYKNSLIPKESTVSINQKLSIELNPSNPSLFLEKLLEIKSAIIITHYKDKDPVSKIWDASNINANSNIIGNLRSRLDFRNGNWQKLNIVKVFVEINNQESAPLISKKSNINQPIKLKEMTKDIAIRLINSEFNLKLDTTNTNYSNINGNGIWSMEPNIKRTNYSLFLILNNDRTKKIHFFQIPANHEVYKNLYERNDRPVFRLLFNVSDTDFRETLMHINFNNFFKGTINY